MDLAVNDILVPHSIGAAAGLSICIVGACLHFYWAMKLRKLVPPDVTPYVFLIPAVLCLAAFGPTAAVITSLEDVVVATNYMANYPSLVLEDIRNTRYSTESCEEKRGLVEEATKDYDLPQFDAVSYDFDIAYGGTIFVSIIASVYIYSKLRKYRSTWAMAPFLWLVSTLLFVLSMVAAWVLQTACHHLDGFETEHPEVDFLLNEDGGGQHPFLDELIGLDEACGDETHPLTKHLVKGALAPQKQDFDDLCASTPAYLYVLATFFVLIPAFFCGLSGYQYYLSTKKGTKGPLTSNPTFLT